MGTPGTGAALTARDLGLLDMDLRQRGAALNSSAVQWAEALDPRSNYGRPQDHQLAPTQTVPWKMSEKLQLSSMAISQAENEFTADQNAYNLAARPDPLSKGLYEGNLAIEQARLGARTSSEKATDWTGIISGLAKMYSGSGGGGLSGGGYDYPSGQVAGGYYGGATHNLSNT